MLDDITPHTDAEQFNKPEERWIQPVTDLSSYLLYQQCMTALAGSPNRADILIRVDNLPVEAQVALIEKLLMHSKIGTLSIYGMPRSERIHIAAEAVLLGLNVRFVESEDEMRVILAKRRAVSIAAQVPNVHPGLPDERRNPHVRGTEW